MTKSMMGSSTNFPDALKLPKSSTCRPRSTLFVATIFVLCNAMNDFHLDIFEGTEKVLQSHQYALSARRHSLDHCVVNQIWTAILVDQFNVALLLGFKYQTTHHSTFSPELVSFAAIVFLLSWNRHSSIEKRVDCSSTLKKSLPPKSMLTLCEF